MVSGPAIIINPGLYLPCVLVKWIAIEYDNLTRSLSIGRFPTTANNNFTG